MFTSLRENTHMPVGLPVGSPELWKMQTQENTWSPQRKAEKVHQSGLLTTKILETIQSVSWWFRGLKIWCYSNLRSIDKGKVLLVAYNQPMTLMDWEADSQKSNSRGHVIGIIRLIPYLQKVTIGASLRHSH